MSLLAQIYITKWPKRQIYLMSDLSLWPHKIATQKCKGQFWINHNDKATLKWQQKGPVWMNHIYWSSRIAKTNLLPGHLPLFQGTVIYSSSCVSHANLRMILGSLTNVYDNLCCNHTQGLQSLWVVLTTCLPLSESLPNSIGSTSHR